MDPKIEGDIIYKNVRWITEFGIENKNHLIGTSGVGTVHWGDEGHYRAEKQVKEKKKNPFSQLKLNRYNI